MKLSIDRVTEGSKAALILKHVKLLDLVDSLSNGKLRLKANTLPSQGGVYVFWWTGDKELFGHQGVNRVIKTKGPNKREVNIYLTDEWIFHRGPLDYIPLYVGKTADNMQKRIGLHLQLGTVRTLTIGKRALSEPRATTTNQVRDRIERMFINEEDTRSLILENVGLSYVILDGDEDSVNRFYLEDRLIGELFPIFNVDIER